ncbi:Pimeloyl-ACP methyl ester carboxylesterase [Noviherbaspirillum humi]|uniref:Pimeloyl-ACP methyl ester carboxylesterase n=1 Tax=Noviherbaspirillum humi TaxID=1688639 RepID=A0A239KFI3_9BURK|nr:alpha/beta hydrolase [Noviherbaspirillum humi]SNT16409.1 Pimeloyl-ACP methyl ester carboxylesterase [Noviherbaspirillum humi]
MGHQPEMKQSKASTRSSGNRTAWAAGVGAVLALAAMTVRRQTKAVEWDNPPLGQFIDVEGMRLHYLERGRGRPVVLLHGRGVTLQDYAISGLLDKVARNYRAIAFDRPGYGYSAKPGFAGWQPMAQAQLLHHALVRLGIENPIVVGHSWGTLVALAMALEFPAYVGGLVLASGYYFPTPRLDAIPQAVPAIPLFGTLMRHTVSPLLGRLMWPAIIRQAFAPADVPQRFEQFPPWMALRPDQLHASAAEAALMVPAAMQLSRRYRELRLPLALLAGAEDRVVDTGVHTESLHRLLPHGDLRILPGVGHMLHYAAPEEIVSAIDAVARAGTSAARRGMQMHPAPAALH